MGKDQGVTRVKKTGLTAGRGTGGGGFRRGGEQRSDVEASRKQLSQHGDQAPLNSHCSNR